MDIKQLNTFLTLSKVKNFTKTAELLGYAQSSITSQIQQLEKEMNVKLFERIGKSVTLTKEGNALLPFVHNIVSLSTDMKNMIAPSDKNHYRITIGAAESLCIYRLPAIIKSYKKKHPNVDIFLKLLDCPEFVPMLSENAIDIAFTMGNKVRNEGITTVFEMPEPIIIAAYPDHPLAIKNEIHAQDFDNEAFILTDCACCYRGSFEKDLLTYNVKPKIVMETGSVQAIKQTAINGLGICVLPEIAIKEEIRTQKLIPLNYKHDYPTVSQLIYHRDKWISPILDEFIQEAAEMWFKAD